MEKRSTNIKFRCSNCGRAFFMRLATAPLEGGPLRPPANQCPHCGRVADITRDRIKEEEK